MTGGQAGGFETAEVSRGDRSARASVRARELPASAPRAAAARAWLTLAGTADEANQAGGAEAAARAGLDALGTEYLDDDRIGTEDDTRMKVLAADIATDPAQRATLLTRVLEARLTMYCWRYEDKALSFSPPLGG